MNLTITILDFGVRFYGGSERSKRLSKCLLRMQKAEKNEPDPNFFDGRKFWRQCVNMIDNASSYLFFNVRKFRTLCAMTLTL